MIGERFNLINLQNQKKIPQNAANDNSPHERERSISSDNPYLKMPTGALSGVKPVSFEKPPIGNIAVIEPRVISSLDPRLRKNRYFFLQFLTIF